MSKEQYKKRIIRIAQVVASIAAVVVIFGNGCSEGGFYALDGSNKSSLDASQIGAQCKSSTDIEVIPGTKTVSFVGANQVLGHLSNCLGLSVPSDATVAVYNDKKGSISTYGAANSITPPMMMAIASIAGEVCSDMIDQEIATGERIFKNMNLQSSSLPSNSVLGSTISNLALSCWRGNETTEERAVLLDLVNQSVVANEANAARKAALLLCTAMLSSTNALLD